jgi:hypothetical protein
MLVQDVKVQLVGPPVPVRGAAAGYLFAGLARDRALAVVSHFSPPVVVELIRFSALALLLLVPVFSIAQEKAAVELWSCTISALPLSLFHIHPML